jgi:hypothetical protein
MAGLLETMTPVRNLASFQLPIEIHTLAVGEDGNLIQDNRAAFRFTFSEGGVNYTATATRATEGTVLALSATIGVMPYTAENLQLRVNMIDVLLAGRNLGSARLGVDSHQRIWVTSEKTVPPPVVPTNLVSAAVGMVLNLKPWVELVRLNLVRGTV